MTAPLPTVDIPPVTLVDGSPLSSEQSKAYHETFTLVAATVRSGKLQTAHKEHPHLHSGASLAPTRSTFLSSHCVRRYLVANRWNVQKAYEATMNSLNWREHHVPTSLDLSGFKDCLASRYMEWRGWDKQGRPSLFIKSVNADLAIPREHRLRYLVVALEKGVSLMNPELSGTENVEQWNMIIDETDKSMDHMDNKFIAQVCPVLFSHYVERLHRAYIINPGMLTQMVFGVVKLLMDERTSSKIVMIDANFDKKSQKLPIPKLVEALGAESVPTYYGGNLEAQTLEQYIDFLNNPPTFAQRKEKPTAQVPH